MKLNSSRRPGGEIATSSMSDIAFLLIVFFMVTSVFAAQKGLVTHNPESDPSTPADPTPAVIIKVLNESSVLLDGKPASPDEIVPYLEPKLRNWPEKPVVLHTLPDASYAAMVRAYDELMRVNQPRGAGGLGLSTPLNLSIPSHREIRHYEELFGVEF